MTLRDTALVLSWVAILMLTLAMSGLIRQMRILVRISGTRRGLTESLEFGGDAETTIALFVDAACQACAVLQPVAVSAAAALRSTNMDAELVALYPAQPRPGWGDVRVLQGQRSLFDRVDPPMIPFAVAQNTYGAVIASSPIGSAQALFDFIEKTTGARLHPDTEPTNEPSTLRGVLAVGRTGR